MAKTQRCIVHNLNPIDLDRAVDDPRLANLLEKGWQVISTLTVQDRQGVPGVALILAPPDHSDWRAIRQWIRWGLLILGALQLLTLVAVL